MKEDKQYTEGIAIEKSKFALWLENYWYHYKWPTIVAIFFILVFTICIAQSCSKEPNDMTIVYVGKQSLSSAQKTSITTLINSNIANSAENKDKKNASFLAYYVLSQEEIERLRSETDKDGKPKNFVNSEFIDKEYDTFLSQLQSGSLSILLLDDWIYQGFFSDGETQNFLPLSEVFGETPAGAIDNYAVRLGDTEMYKNNPELQALPEDTVVCLHKKLLGKQHSSLEIETFKTFAQLVHKEEETK